MPMKYFFHADKGGGRSCTAVTTHLASSPCNVVQHHKVVWLDYNVQRQRDECNGQVTNRLQDVCKPYGGMPLVIHFIFC